MQSRTDRDCSAVRPGANFSGSEKAWRTYTDNSGYGFYADDEYYMLDKRGGDAVANSGR